MLYEYQPVGVCSRKFIFEIEEGKITNVDIIGGCNGNLQAISKLIRTKMVNDVISLLDGIKCNAKDTSCPDQIAKALSAYKKINS